MQMELEINARRLEAYDASKSYQRYIPLGKFLDHSGNGLDVEVLLDRSLDLGLTVPPLDDLSALYADRKSKDFQPGESDLIRWVKRGAFEKEAAYVLSRFMKRPKAMLDYGCGDGRLTNAYTDLLPDARVMGADFDPAAPAAMKPEGYLPHEALASRQGTFDALLARHVLEHADDPAQLLGEFNKLLTPGGSMFIEVPNRNTPWGRIFGKYWDGWYTPFHRVHFSAASLRKMIERTGFRVDREEQADMPHMGRTFRNMFNCKYNNGLFLLGALLHPLQVAVGRLSGERTVIRVWCSKVSETGT
jgi:SAM-dependent methyltransferase